MTRSDRVPVPALRPTAAMTVPPYVDGHLHSGLRVVSVHCPGVPLVEMRLRIPLECAQPEADARNRMLAETILSGTRRYDRLALAERVQELGGLIGVEVDTDHLLISVVVLVRHLHEMLGLLSDVVMNATYPDAEVLAERDRLLQRLRMARSKASVHARETLHRHLYGNHPYGRHLPALDDVAAVTPGDLRSLHAQRVVPAGSVLALVGDVPPEEALAVVGGGLAGWLRDGTPLAPLPDQPPLIADPSLLVHRPGSVQSSVRIGGPALRRQDPGYAAMQLANLIYAGYFSSRLVANIREDKGYTYSPRSRIHHASAGSTLVIEADVATAVTAPALLEMWYELGRLSTLRPAERELDDVRQYAVGTLAMSISTRAGLASTLMTLIGVGLDLNWVRQHPARLAAVTAEDIYHVGVHLLAPCRLAAVVIGDAAETAEPLKAFGPWEVRT